MQACVAAGIAKGELVHVDASLIRADVAWESLAVRHVGAVAEANDDEAIDPKDDRDVLAYMIFPSRHRGQAPLDKPPWNA